MWKVMGASVQGTSHVRLGLLCQDAYDYRAIGEKGVILAVADGLSTASKSDIGAKIAVRIAVSKIYESLYKSIPTDEKEWEILIINGFHAVRNVLREQASSEGLKIKNYATTLIVAVVMDSTLITGQIGDGGVVAQFENDELSTISQPQRGEFANETMPITTRYVFRRIRFSFPKGKIKSFALFTDGIQSLALELPSNTPFPPFFIPFFDALKSTNDIKSTTSSLIELLESDRVCEKTDDDKTLVVVVEEPN